MASLGRDFTVNWHNGPSWNAVKSCQFVKHISGEGCSSVDPTPGRFGWKWSHDRLKGGTKRVADGFLLPSHTSPSQINFKVVEDDARNRVSLNPAGQQIVLEIDEVWVLWSALYGDMCHLRFGHRLRSSAGGTTDFQAILPSVARPPGIPCQLCNVTCKKKYSTAYFQITRTILKVMIPENMSKYQTLPWNGLNIQGNAL